MNERDFQKRVTDMAARFGWRHWHIPSPGRVLPGTREFVHAASGGGIPDLILISDDPPRLVFMELKGDGGKLSDNQREFLQAAQEVARIARDVDTDVEPALEEMGCFACPPAVGVYAFWPKDEPLVEQLLRTKVLT